MAMIKRILQNQKGFGFIEYMVIFVLVFPLVLFVIDLIVWGSKIFVVNGIIGDAADFMAMHGGANETTVTYLQQRFAEAGLDPSHWDLTISGGQKMRGDELSVAVESTYTFNSIRMIGIDLQFPIKASATVPSQVWIR
ncbi:hypothetical protein [Brevibacillus marinus]|uniref:hypothetical protein n=1 Tax=Brevibacillus marinus TaxID=2496837 RepID=UPI000F821D68|nr:hypothetical protein [Brevibacillus marinus]